MKAACGMWLWLCVSLLVGSVDVLDCAAATSILSSDLPGGGEEKLQDGLPGECPSPEPSLYYRPVIGILSHPGDGASGRISNATNASFIAASYVKFAQAAGARVIPLIFNEPREILHEKLKLVNGVLFTGGWAKGGLYFETATEIFQRVLERNDGGEHFPLFAICLGFEILSMIITKNNKILDHFGGINQASTLTFTEFMAFRGTVFQGFPPALRTKLTKECLVMQNHKYGISPGKMEENRDLSGFFKILTTSRDDVGRVYVSTVQGNRYPVTGFQWHPEKNAFEWGLSAIPHSEDAVEVTQHVANFFISEARKSSNRPSAEAVLGNLIYNFSPTYCGKDGKGYDEVYIFS